MLETKLVILMKHFATKNLFSITSVACASLLSQSFSAAKKCLEEVNLCGGATLHIATSESSASQASAVLDDKVEMYA